MQPHQPHSVFTEFCTLASNPKTAFDQLNGLLVNKKQSFTSPQLTSECLHFLRPFLPRFSSTFVLLLSLHFPVFLRHDPFQLLELINFLAKRMDRNEIRSIAQHFSHLHSAIVSGYSNIKLHRNIILFLSESVRNVIAPNHFSYLHLPLLRVCLDYGYFHVLDDLDLHHCLSMDQLFPISTSKQVHTYFTSVALSMANNYKFDKANWFVCEAEPSLHSSDASLGTFRLALVLGLILNPNKTHSLSTSTENTAYNAILVAAQAGNLNNLRELIVKHERLFVNHCLYLPVLFILDVLSNYSVKFNRLGRVYEEVQMSTVLEQFETDTEQILRSIFWLNRNHPRVSSLLKFSPQLDASCTTLSMNHLKARTEYVDDMLSTVSSFLSNYKERLNENNTLVKSVLRREKQKHHVARE
ncbi:hypothetical protein RCL1_000200 [Eukaryota sp. TZLM3-RCL]